MVFVWVRIKVIKSDIPQFAGECWAFIDKFRKKRCVNTPGNYDMISNLCSVSLAHEREPQGMIDCEYFKSK